MGKKRKIPWGEPFRGDIKRMRLWTGWNVCACDAVPGKEWQQKLTVRRNGKVRLKGYDCSPACDEYPTVRRDQIVRNQRRKIEKLEAKRLLEAVAIAFDENHFQSQIPIYPGGMGVWELELTNTKGEVYRFEGNLDDKDASEEYLSSWMRGLFGIGDFYGFDGSDRLHDVRKVTVERYRRGGIKVTAKGKVDVPYTDTDQWMNWEKLTVDLDRKTIGFSRRIYPKGKQSREYDFSEFEETFAKDFYAGFDASDLFTTGSETVPGKRKDYEITIDYRDGISRFMTGRFDKEGLPRDFGVLAKFVKKMIRGFPETWEIWNPDFYDRPRYGEGEYIFCSVIFDEGGQKYYYLTEDKTIEEGDVVFVPVGPENHVIPGVVTDIEYFTGEDAPYPLEKVKNIIRKATEKEMKIDMDEIDAYLNPEDGDISLSQKLLMKRREKRGVRRTFFTQ